MREYCSARYTALRLRANQASVYLLCVVTGVAGLVGTAFHTSVVPFAWWFSMILSAIIAGIVVYIRMTQCTACQRSHIIKEFMMYTRQVYKCRGQCSKSGKAGDYPAKAFVESSFVYFYCMAVICVVLTTVWLVFGVRIAEMKLAGVLCFLSILFQLSVAVIRRDTIWSPLYVTVVLGLLFQVIIALFVVALTENVVCVGITCVLLATVLIYARNNPPWGRPRGAHS